MGLRITVGGNELIQPKKLDNRCDKKNGSGLGQVFSGYPVNPYILLPGIVLLYHRQEGVKQTNSLIVIKCNFIKVLGH